MPLTEVCSTPKWRRPSMMPAAFLPADPTIHRTSAFMVPLTSHGSKQCQCANRRSQNEAMLRLPEQITDGCNALSQSRQDDTPANLQHLESCATIHASDTP
eukprot:3356010-Rhodomonas_salina.3